MKVLEDGYRWPPVSSREGLGPGQALQLVLSSVDPSTVVIPTSLVPGDHLALQKQTPLRALTTFYFYSSPDSSSPGQLYTHHAILQFIFILQRRACPPLPGLAPMAWPYYCWMAPGCSGLGAGTALLCQLEKDNTPVAVRGWVWEMVGQGS